MLSTINMAVNLVTYFEDIGSECYKWAIGLPVSVLSLDFSRGDSISLLKEHGFPDDKVANVSSTKPLHKTPLMLDELQ